MVDFVTTLLFSAVMGFSVYLSLPIVLRKRMGERKIRFLNAVAVGILVFLMADIYSDVGPILLNNTFQGYGTSPLMDAVFGSSVVGGFLVLAILEIKSKRTLPPMVLALVIAIAMGFQNLSEGLVYGAASVQYGNVAAVSLVILAGFTIQNLTEGFPIAAPLAGTLDNKKRIGSLSLIFLIGGVPTILGGGVGYYYNSTVVDMIFYGLGIGTILYVILPMFRILFRESDAPPKATVEEGPGMEQQVGTLNSVLNRRAVYIGIFAGFMLGWLVNLI